MGKEAETPTTQAAESADLTLEGKAHSLLDQISSAALEGTGGDVWRSGQPLSTPGTRHEADSKSADGDGSTPAPSKEEVKEAPAWTPPIEYLKKYSSKEEAERGIQNLLDTLAQKDQQLASLQKAPEPQKTEEPLDPADELTQWGLPKEPLVNVMKQVFVQTLQDMAKPALAQREADQKIIESYPEYKDRFNDLSQWLDQNPDVKNQVVEAEKGGHYLLARQYAWLQFTRNGHEQAETEIKAEAAKTKAETKREKMDARTMANGQSTEPRSRPEPDQSERRFIKADEMEKLVTLAQQGYAEPLWRRAIGETLPKDVFPDS